MPSLLNVNEILANTNEFSRKKQLAAVATLARATGFLPLPRPFMRRVAEGTLAGERIINMQFMYADIPDISAEQVEAIGRASAAQAERWKRGIDSDRARVHAELKKRGETVDEWDAVVPYLDQRRSQYDLTGRLMEIQWRALGLPADFDVFGRMHLDQAWRIYFEGQGANYYQQCVQSNREKLTHPPDIAQFVYLSLARKRIVVTDDAAFLRLAQAVLVGRYRDVEVMRSDEFLP